MNVEQTITHLRALAQKLENGTAILEEASSKLTQEARDVSTLQDGPGARFSPGPARYALAVRILITSMLLLAAFTGTAPALAQTAPPVFHVTAVREWQPTDPPKITQAFRTYVITGTMSGRKYLAFQLYSWGSVRFMVGSDYAVTKEDAQALSVTMEDKKGRPVKERLDVVSVEEATK